MKDFSPPPLMFLNMKDLPALGSEQIESVVAVDFPIIEIKKENRKPVSQVYDASVYEPQFADYVIVAHITETGDNLIVPADLAHCRFICGQHLISLDMNKVKAIQDSISSKATKLIGDHYET